MQMADIRTQWEGAAPGWARWEATVATWMAPATETMLTMARVDAGARVLDLASGAGSQRCGLPGGLAHRGMWSRVTLPTRCCTTCGRTPAPLVWPMSRRWLAPPSPGQPGIFSLGVPGVIERLFADSGFVGVERRTLALPLRMPSATQALVMMQEAFGTYRAVVGDRPEAVRVAAWAEVAETLKTFETPTGFVAPAEMLVAAGVKPA
jgi:hypothetical protein